MNTRMLRRRFWRWLLAPLFRTVNAALLDAGQLPAAGTHRILVMRPNHRLGNILLTTPLLVELEHAFPGAEVDILTGGDLGREIFSGFHSVQRIHTLPRRILQHPVHALKTLRALKRARYDLVVNAATDSYSSRVLLALAKPCRVIGIPPTDSHGHENWARILPQAPKHFGTMPVFMVRHALSPEGGIGDVRDGAPYPRLDMRLSPAERLMGQHALNDVLRTRIATPGAAVVGVFADATGAKRFESAWWLKFLAILTARHPEYLIVEIIPADGCSRLEDRFPTYYSSSLRKLAAFIGNMAYFISADGGVMHLACASGTPTMGLFSVTDPAQYAPYGGYNQACRAQEKIPEETAELVSRALEAAITVSNIPESAGLEPADARPADAPTGELASAVPVIHAVPTLADALYNKPAA